MNARLAILNIWVDPVTTNEAVAAVKCFIEDGNRLHTVFAANPEKNFSVIRNALVYEAFKTADLLIPDGIGIVWAARLLYGAKLTRVPGVELMHEICRMSAENGYRIFLYGAREEVSQAADEALRVLYPSITIVGRENGYIHNDAMGKLIERINESRAEILFLALGSPQQEKWITEYRYALKTVRVCQGIGGTLDTIAGTVKRAPALWCRYNMEWLYRLLSEPARIRRQKVLPVFALMVLGEKFRRMLRVKVG